MVPAKAGNLEERSEPTRSPVGVKSRRAFGPALLERDCFGLNRLGIPKSAGF